MFKQININFSEQFKTLCLNEAYIIKNSERSSWKLDNKVNYLWKRKLLRKTEDDSSIKSMIIYYDSISDNQSVFSQIPVSEQLEQAILEYIPNKLLELEKPKFYWQFMEHGNIVPPHIDGYRKSCINFYLQVNDEKTIFFEKKRDGIKLDPPKIGGKIDVQQAPEFFCPEWLEYKGSFQASIFDTYILDVDIPHSVENQINTEPRISLTSSFKTDYKTLINYFVKET